MNRVAVRGKKTTEEAVLWTVVAFKVSISGPGFSLPPLLRFPPSSNGLFRLMSVSGCDPSWLPLLSVVAFAKKCATRLYFLSVKSGNT